MEMERIALSQRERDRLRVLHEVNQKHLTQKAGPQPLREQLRVDLLRTQFGRALNELGIEWIAAHSPQEVAVAASTAGPDDRGPTAQLGGNRRGRGKAA
jgi:hypothetical protein